MANTMEAADEQHTCQDAERSQKFTIDYLPDEVLLEIFDSYRQGVDSYYHQWRQEIVWVNLAHVCRKWRAVMFASSSRLDLGITVGNTKPRHIKTVLSGPLSIFFFYRSVYGQLSGSALWRMRAALKHRDRVCEINFRGCQPAYDQFFKETNCAFPVLESLDLFDYGLELPDTFLGGPDLSYLPLRRLKLGRVSLASISRFLLSVTALTDLSLLLNTAFSPSPQKSLLAFATFNSQRYCPSLKINFFPLQGRYGSLDHLVAGLSAPSLQDVCIDFYVEPHVAHLSRFIDEIEEHYYAVHVTFRGWDFRLSLLTQSEYINHCKPHFTLGAVPIDPPISIMGMSRPLSTRFTTVEELRVTFNKEDVRVWEDSIPWRGFLQQFPRLKALRTEGANDYHIARTLLQDHEEPDDLALLPALEEIELSKGSLLSPESQRGSELAAFGPFVSARQQAGRPVKVFFGA
ncbi:hypothetical protein BJV77DRAFT_1066840 [Russula vinacea]|nr:hypothetical protein BJV77DRAFT_1066840 [Russula vinacea]